jgi:hypothetical protein
MPDAERLLEVGLAKVRWAKPRCSGVEFLKVYRTAG